MGFAHRAFVAAGVGFAVSAIVGCGSNGGRLLSASESNQLSEQLNQVTQALAADQCTQAQQYLAHFQSTVERLGGVNSTLIANLQQGASTIASLTSSECQVRTVTTPKTHTRTASSTTPTKTATTTTATFTTPTQTNTQPTYSQPTYSQPNTSTTGGTCPTCSLTSTSTSTSTTTPTTTPNGGIGLGDTSSGTTAGSTSSTTTTSDAGGGF